jgi:hypothetical protein
VVVSAEATSAAYAFASPNDTLLIAPLGGGHINASWVVASGRGRFVLQRLNARVFPRPDLVMENVVRVTAFAGEGIVPRLLSTRDGHSWYVDGAGAWWRALEYVEGTVTHAAPRGPDDAYQGALAFGRFQRILGAYEGPRLHETIPGFHDTPRRVAALERSAAADVAGRRAGARAELAALLARRSLAQALTDARLPERIVHNDAKLANVLFDIRSGAARCVVDLDTVMPGLSLHDFGDLARSGASDAAEDETDLARVVVRPELLDALAAGFLDGTGDLLGTEERGLLTAAARVITYEQAVRFLTDHLDGDRYYRVAPERPLHNLERARAQIALLAGFETLGS